MLSLKVNLNGVSSVSSLTSPFAACNGNQQGVPAGAAAGSVFLSLCHPIHDEQKQEQSPGRRQGAAKPRGAGVHSHQKGPLIKTDCL